MFKLSRVRSLLLPAASVFISLAAANVSSAAPCTSGTLADYIRLNATGGCTVGIATFFNFAAPTPTSTSELALASASDIDITPGFAGNLPSLSFSSSYFSLTGNNSVNYYINYTVDPPIVIPGQGELGDPFQGNTSATENICEGGSFANQCGNGPSAVLVVTPTSPVANVVFNQPTFLVDIQTIISLNSTSSQPASIDSLTQGFVALPPTSANAPEPGAGSIAGVGGLFLAGFLFLKRRSRVAVESI